LIEETFVASDPTSAYAQAVKKYGNDVKLLSARQVEYDDGELWCEVQIAIPQDIYLSKTLESDEGSAEEQDNEKVLMDEISHLKAQLDQMKSSLQSEITSNNTVASDVKTLLMRKGLAEAWLNDVVDTLAGSSVSEDSSLLVSYVLEEIDETLNIKAESFDNPKVMMLVGPTGTGKTTTIAKLAARYAYLMERPYKVALLNLDSYKVGALEQLGHYAEIMQIEHIAIDSLNSFKDTLESLEEYDVILVDTAGMSPYDTQKFIRTVEYVNSDTDRDFEVNMVLPATVKYEDMEDIYKNFSFLNLDSVIITKFDETKHLGTLLNFMLLYDIPMSYFSTGQEVPDDLLVASKEYLLERFIGDVDEG
jgi:flagellar biosynthesis protein FlhF